MAKLWNYHHSLLQVSGSLFHYFGIDRGHGTDQDVDAWLKNKPSCIVALLIDAMGTSILEKHLPKDAFLRKHMRKSVSTVFLNLRMIPHLPMFNIMEQEFSWNMYEMGISARSAR